MTGTNVSSDTSSLDVVVQLTWKKIDQRHWRQDSNQMGRLDPGLAARTNGQRFWRIAESSHGDAEPVRLCLGVDGVVALVEVKAVVAGVKDVTPVNLFVTELPLTGKSFQ